MCSQASRAGCVVVRINGLLMDRDSRCGLSNTEHQQKPLLLYTNKLAKSCFPGGHRVLLVGWLLYGPQVSLNNRTVYQRDTPDCRARNKDSKVTLCASLDAVTARVSFRSRAGDCFEVMSARLPWPVISNASAVLEEEATTWAEEATCSSVCGSTSVWKWGCTRTGLQCAKKKKKKKPNGNIYIGTQSKSKEQKKCDSSTQI